MGTPSNLDLSRCTVRMHSTLLNGYTHYVKEDGTHVIEKSLGQGSKLYVEFNESGMIYEYLDYEHGNTCNYAGPIDNEILSELQKFESELSEFDHLMEQVAQDAINCDTHGNHIFAELNKKYKLTKIIHPDQLDNMSRPRLTKFEKFIIRASVLLILLAVAALVIIGIGSLLVWFSNFIMRIAR